jgi:hypothetical protein
MHNIDKLPAPFDQNRRDWLSGVSSALLRLVGNNDALGATGVYAVSDAITSGRWQLDEEDRGTEQGSALLALLSSQHSRLIDLGTHVSTYVPLPTMDEGRQKLALALVAGGCDPLHAGVMGPADALDLAFASHAPELLDAWLGHVDWQNRRIQGVPWLHMAARAGMIEALEVLERHGADVGQVDEHGNTALFYASDRDSVRWLVKRGADRSHLNASGGSVQSHWQGARDIRGARLNEMLSALGRSSIKLDSAAAIGQFLEIAKKAPAGRLVKEARRLKIKGDETVDGVGILASAAWRLAPQCVRASMGGQEQNTAWEWFNKVVRWPESMSVGRQEDIGVAMLVAKIGMTHIGLMSHKKVDINIEQALAQHCTDRGWDVDEVKTLGVRSIAQDSKTMTHGLAEALCQQLISRPGFMEQEADVLVKLLKSMENSAAEAVLKELKMALRAESDRASGWGVPGLIGGLIGLSRSTTSFSTSLREARRGLRQSVIMVAQHGGVWDEEAMSQAARLGARGGSDAGEGIEEIRALAEEAQLSQHTAGSGGAKPRGLRL